MMKDLVRCPKEGYLTDEKQVYRESVWENIANIMPDMGDSNVLLLPSYHSAEIKMAISKGVKEENIYACDESAAMLATVVWRKEYPRVNILGNKLSRAIDRLHQKNIKINIANLDLCTNLQQWMFDDVADVVNKLMGDKIILGITLLKGRESSSEATLAKLLFKDIKGAANRIKIVNQFLLRDSTVCTKLCYQSEYKSGQKMMVYGVIDILRQEYYNYHYHKPYVNRIQEIKNILAIDDEFHETGCGYSMKEVEKAEKARKSILDRYWSEMNRMRGEVWEEAYNNQYENYDRGDRYQLVSTTEQSTALRLWNTASCMPYHRI